MTKENQGAKKLTLTEMKKQVKKLSAQTEHEILVEDVLYKIKIDNVFRKTKQYELLDDLVAFFEEGNTRVEILDVATPYTTMLFVKHFTDIDVPNDIDEAIELMNIFIDLDLINTVLNLMPEDEVLQVYEILKTTASRMRENIEETLLEIDTIKEQVENKEVLEIAKE